MKFTHSVITGILALSIVNLCACVATSKQMSNADKLSENYQRISKLSAYKDDYSDLHLCIDIFKPETAYSESVMLRIPWSDFERMSFTTLIAVGGGKYLLDARDYVNGCEIRPDLLPINIEIINVDLEVDNFSELHKFVNNLATAKTGFSLYLLNSDKFKLIESKCHGFFGEKECVYDLTYSWPRLVIKAKTKNNRPPVSIVSGHTGEKRGYSAAPIAKAIAVDILTFPVQAIFFTGWYILGGKH